MPGCQEAKGLFPNAPMNFSHVMGFYQECIVRLENWAPYWNDIMAPEWWQNSPALCIHEVTNLALGAITLLHAWKHNGARFWWGFFLFGFAMEVVGILVGSHAHGQFLFHLTFFCPLKEALWYPMTLWLSYFYARSFWLDAFAESCLVALLQQLVNLPYESIGKRPGINLLTYNTDFPMANVSVEYMGAPVINVLANFIMPFFVTLVARFAAQHNMSFWGTVLLLGLSAPLAGPFFMPFNLLKLVGCVDRAFPKIDTSKLDLRQLFDSAFVWYCSCMKNSHVTELAAWSFLIALSACFLAYRASKVTKRPQAHPPMSLLVPFTVVSLQFLEYSVLVLLFDNTSSVENIVNSLILYASLYLCWCTVHAILATSNRTTCSSNIKLKEN